MNPLLIPQSLRDQLYAIAALNLAVQFSDQPVWFVGAAITLVFLRAIIDRLSSLRIPRAVHWLIQVMAIVALWNHYENFLGPDAAGGLLVVLTGLKVLELSSRRDVFTVVVLCLLLLTVKLINTQAVLVMLFATVDVLVIVAFLISFQFAQALSLTSVRSTMLWRVHLGRAVRVCAWTIPVMLVLFLFFPRFTTGFAKKSERSAGVIGFSDRLSPGSVASLIRENRLMFRANFLNGLKPNMGQLYWRGAVLNVSNGLRWSRTAQTEYLRPKFMSDAGDGGIVEIFLEPSDDRWLYALDFPYTVKLPSVDQSNQVVQRNYDIFELARPLVGRGIYQVQYSLSSQKVPPHSNGELLKIEEPVSDQLKALVRDFKGQSQTPSEFINLLMNYFQSNGFTYSLTPVPSATVEQFLFQAKQGYCEHYAGATATLLRIAKIPSRVVVGFQGGATSLLGDYVMVNSVDAHAWVEFWNEPFKRWQRLDPTMFVAPARIQLGAERFLESQHQGLMAGISRFGRVGQIYYRSRLLFDQIETAWVGFLLRFDFEYQQQLLAKFGLPELARWSLSILLICGLFFSIALISFFENLRKSGSRSDRVVQAYDQLQLLLARHKLSRRANEGPLTYYRRAVHQFRGERRLLEALFKGIIASKYGEQSWTDEIDQRFHKQLKLLKKALSTAKQQQQIAN